MFKRLATNWKTSSAGAGLLTVAIVHIGYLLWVGEAITEKDISSTIAKILAGLAALAAGDATKVEKDFVKKSEVALDGTVSIEPTKKP